MELGALKSVGVKVVEKLKNKMDKEIEDKYFDDLNIRVKSFNEKLMPLLADNRLALGAVPFITSDGRIAARPHVFDDTKKVEKEENVSSA